MVALIGNRGRADWKRRPSRSETEAKHRSGADFEHVLPILFKTKFDLHWSLVIICIPNKEDNSGPIILHLDSLRMHCSKSIFSNVKRFLIEEWKFLKEEEVLPALPIADHIWDNLSRKIVEKVIEVPQQKNDYDCGLFVLYFMERFLEEVPERLSKSHLEMFGRRWFKPEEASTLRTTIHKLLIHEFSKENEADILDDSSE